VAWVRHRNRANRPAVRLPKAVRLIEPLGLLHGMVAAEAVAAGLALPLAGGPAAFTLARLIGPDAPPRLVAAPDIPAGWDDIRGRITAAPPAWAGLPTTRPAIMGILNVTPDSFSDGGKFADPATAIAAGQAMLAAGADILDIGGESTRPDAAPVPAPVEQARILDVIRALASSGRLISADTRNAATMAAALDAGASIINDVSGLLYDSAAARVVAERHCPVILMHMRGTPATMRSLALYNDPAVDILAELAARVTAARAAGIREDNIAVDPGIGFAKNTSQNRELLYRMALLTNLGCRIVLGVSRKSMIGDLGQQPDPTRRLPGSLAAGLFGLAQGATILRTHDVAETAQAVRVWQALQDGDLVNSATHGSNSAPIPATTDH